MKIVNWLSIYRISGLNMGLNNFAPNQGICVFTLGLLCIEYELDT